MNKSLFNLNFTNDKILMNDSTKNTNNNRKLSTTSVVSMETLPERVSELFMLDDNFFRSPFMRHKIPNLLFTNGTNGLEPIFTSSSSSDETLRSSSPSQHQQQQNRQNINRNLFDLNNTYSNNNEFNLFQSNLLNNQFNSSLPLSNNHNHNNNTNDYNNVVIRNIPIKIVDRNSNNSPKPNLPTLTNSTSNNNNNNHIERFSPNFNKNLTTPPQLPPNFTVGLNPLENDEDLDSSSLSQRSAPPELWQMSRAEFGNNFSTPIGAVEKLAWRKLSTPRDSNENQKNLTTPKNDSSNSSSNGFKQNPASNKLWPTEPAPTPPAMANRLFTPHRNSRSSSPAINQLSTTNNNNYSINFRPTTQYTAAPRQNSFGNSVNLDYRSSSSSNNPSIQRSHTPTFMNSSTTTINQKKQQQQPHNNLQGEKFRITNAISTPSLYSINTIPTLSPAVNENINNKSNNKDASSNQNDNGYPFLRRTQTAYTIPTNQLPRRDSEPSVVIAASLPSTTTNIATITKSNQINENQRHSLHETQIQLEKNEKNNSPMNTSKSPSLVSLIFRGGTKSMINSTQKSPKKTLFAPLACVKRSANVSEIEKEPQNNRKSSNTLNVDDEKSIKSSIRSRSPSLNASTLRLTEFMPKEDQSQAQQQQQQNSVTPVVVDAVEEAIRSLETFDPNDYILQNYQQQKQNANNNIVKNDLKESNEESQQQSSTNIPPTPPKSNPPLVSQESQGGSIIIKNNKSLSNFLVNNPEQRDSIVSSSSASSSLSTSAESATTTTSNNTNNSQNSSLESSEPTYNNNNNINSIPKNLTSTVWQKNSGQRFISSSSESATPTGSILELVGNNQRVLENRSPIMGNSHINTMGNTSGIKIQIPNGNAYYNMNYYQQQQKQQQQNKQQTEQQSNKTTRNSNLMPNKNNNNNNNLKPLMEHAAEVDQMLARLQTNTNRRLSSPSLTNNDSADIFMPSPDYDDESLAAAEAEVHLRKRFLCTQLTDCTKVIEINAMKISQFAGTSPAWRNAQILRHNLAAIRDTIYTIEFALDELLEGLSRIALNRHDSRYEEFYQLSTPLYNSQQLIKRLRENLDSTGWSLAVLARNTNNNNNNMNNAYDSLDQFVAILKQLPKDCYKLVQWVYQLGVWNDLRNDSSAIFLSSAQQSNAGPPPPPQPAPIPIANVMPLPPRPQSQPTQLTQLRLQNNKTPTNQIEQSNTPTSPLYANTNGINFNFKNQQQQQQYLKQQQISPKTQNNSTTPLIQSKQAWNPSSSNKQQNNLTKPLQNLTISISESTYNPEQSLSPSSLNNTSTTDELLAMDGGESTTSSTSSTTTTTITTPQPLEELTKRGAKILSETEDGDMDSRMVYEEDDLISVASESVDSLYGDYSYVNGLSPPISSQQQQNLRSNSSMPIIMPKRRFNRQQQQNRGTNAILQRHNSNAQQHQQLIANQKVHMDLVKRLTREEVELIQFYQPQVESHIEELCRLIEEFFNVVEEQHMQGAKIFVQKIQMICIKAQTLVCIARMVFKDDSITTKALKIYLENESNRMDSLLNACISNAKIAKDMTKSVPAVQAMVSSVVGVSQAALNFKLFWKSCI